MFELVLFDEGLEQAVDAMFRSSFYSTEEIVDFFCEIASDDPAAGLNEATVEEDVRGFLKKSADALAKASAHWPVMTDNARLTQTFEHLNDSGIRALENYGYEASDCSELYHKIRGQAQWRGYCFYHIQDLIRAVLGGGLAVRYSAAVDQPSDDDNRLIGEEIVAALRRHGLAPEWDGDSSKVIYLPIEWQRLRPGS